MNERSPDINVMAMKALDVIEKGKKSNLYIFCFQEKSQTDEVEKSTGHMLNEIRVSDCLFWPKLQFTG